MRVIQNLLEVCDKVKNSWEPGLDYREDGKKSQAKSGSSARVIVVFTFWMTLIVFTKFKLLHMLFLIGAND
jgi:hypothetical protein